MFNEIDGKNQPKKEDNGAFPENEIEKKENNQLGANFTADKNKAEDIFAETEAGPKPKPPIFEKKADTGNNKPEDYQENNQGPNHQKIFFLVFLILLMFLLVIGGVFGYRALVNKDDSALDTDNPVVEEEGEIPSLENSESGQENNEQQSEPDVPLMPENKNENDNQQTDEYVENLSALDSDGDGLTDEEEWLLGTAIDNPDTDGDGLSDWEEVKIYKTDPLNPDTDGDGLFDREEVKVYKTDPLNPDTDGDGYSDGDEVKAGYNPLGSGRLFELE